MNNIKYYVSMDRITWLELTEEKYEEAVRYGNYTYGRVVSDSGKILHQGSWITANETPNGFADFCKK